MALLGLMEGFGRRKETPLCCFPVSSTPEAPLHTRGGQSSTCGSGSFLPS
ncbi:hypothetical protein LEMLEM_LOCUS19929 [Lemmus lemmus]